MKREILDCVCHSLDHCYIITYDDWANENCVYIEPHLPTCSFWDRLKYAVKYLFGWKCRYGCFDEIIVTKENYQPFKHLVEYIENEKKYNIFSRLKNELF